MNSSLELSSQDDRKLEKNGAGLTVTPQAISALPESTSEVADLPSSEGDGNNPHKSQWDDSGNERKRQRCDGHISIPPSDRETSTYLPPMMAQDSLSSLVHGRDSSSDQPRLPQHQSGGKQSRISEEACPFGVQVSNAPTGNVDRLQICDYAGS
jgi:hypothetical protein